MRAPSGQTMAEGAASLVIMSLLLVSSVAFIAGTGAYMLDTMKAQYAAQQGAQTAVNCAEWLGAVRPDAGITSATVAPGSNLYQHIQNAVDKCLRQMGMPGSLSINTTINPVSTTDGLGNAITFNTYTVKIACTGVGLMSGGFIPSIVPPVFGTATMTSGNTAPPAQAWIFCAGGDGNSIDATGSGGVCVPAYNGARDSTTPPLKSPVIRGVSATALKSTYIVDAQTPYQPTLPDTKTKSGTVYLFDVNTGSVTPGASGTAWPGWPTNNSFRQGW